MALGTRNFILTMWSCEGIRQKLASRGSLGGNFKYGCLMNAKDSNHHIGQFISFLMSVSTPSSR